MKVFRQSVTWTAGVAIFSMFFGAGNVIFPLQLGEVTGHQIGYSLAGLLLTAIGAPILGLIGTILFEGNCRRFVSRIGRLPGALLILILLAAIGPFGAMPRCITVSHAALLPYFPDLSLAVFSLLCGILILLCVARRRLILPILGDLLSPLLLGCLAVVIVKGLLSSEAVPDRGVMPLEAFKFGLIEGYKTMDLPAANLFAVGIWVLLKEKLGLKDSQSGALMRTTIAASLIAGLCLGVVYVGLSVVGALHPQVLRAVPQESLLVALSIHVLGPKLAVVANVAIALACFTTVISLVMTLAEVLLQEFPRLRLLSNHERNYDLWVLIVTVISVLMANLGFEQLSQIIGPAMVICYPAIIVLTLCNTMYQLWGFKYVKLPVYGTLGLTVINMILR